VVLSLSLWQDAIAQQPATKTLTSQDVGKFDFKPDRYLEGWDYHKPEFNVHILTDVFSILSAVIPILV